MRTKYWIECVECALEEAGVIATKEQIEIIAGSVEVGHENIGMAFGDFCIPNPIVEENKRLREKIDIEKSKVVCPECKSKGSITETWGACGRSSTSRCSWCNGEGKVLPEYAFR